MSCSEVKRQRAFEKAASYPDYHAIPTPAVLVIGAYPDEQRNGRTFYDDPSYYLFGLSYGPKPPNVDRSRFIECDFNDFTRYTPVALLYCGMFDVVIVDEAVLKFIKDPVVIKHFISMVKPGGQMIMPSTYIGLSTMSSLNGPIQQQKEQATARMLALLAELKYQVYIDSISTMVSENKFANRIYRGMIDSRIIDDPDTQEGIIIQKPAAGGSRRGRKTRRNRKLRRRSMRGI